MMAVRGPKGLLGGLVLAVALGGVPTGAAGQDRPAEDPGGDRPVTVAPVPPGHWVYPLLDAASAAGWAEGWLSGRAPVSGARILDVLAEALDDAALPPEWRRTFDRARTRLLHELGLTAGRRLRATARLGLRATGGPPIESASARPDAAFAGADLIWRPGAGVALWADPAIEIGRPGFEVPVPRLGAAWDGAGVRVEAVHDAVRYGAGSRGGVVSGGRARLFQLGVGPSRPWRPEDWLRFLGSVDGSLSASRIGEDEYGPAAGLVAAEVRIRPTDWLLLQAQRSAVIVWTADGEHPGARDLAYMLIGKHTPFDDQRFAVGARVDVRPFGVALSPYMELGIEDSAGMLEDPGVILGLLLPSLPVGGVPVQARYEYNAFGDDARVLWSGLCCFEARNWYRHGLPTRTEYRDGDGDLLGHPLGGYGHEHLLRLAAPLLDAGLWIEGTLFAREREAGNLLHDLVPGRSQGASLELRVYAGRVDASLALVHEKGDEGWSRTRLDLEGRLPVR